MAASAPKPKLVVPKKPLLHRTWFRLVLAALVLVALGGASVAGWASYRANQREEAAREEVRRTGALIEAGLATVGQQTPGGFTVLPQMPAAVAQFQSGEARPNRVRRQAQEWVESTRSAAAQLEGIETDNERLRSAVTRMEEALGAYSRLAERLVAAVDLEGKEQQDELVAISDQVAVISSNFSTAWFEYQAARQEAGLEGGPVVPGGGPVIPEAPAP